MKLSGKTHAPEFEKISRRAHPVGEYRKDPGHLEKAVRAARHYARRYQRTYIVVPGNSYGKPVFHLAFEDTDLLKFTAMKCQVIVIIVKPSGQCFHALAG